MPQASLLMPREKERVCCYRFDGVVDGVLGGAPEPGAIRAFPFGLEDVGYGGALEAALFQPRSGGRCGRRGVEEAKGQQRGGAQEG